MIKKDVNPVILILLGVAAVGVLIFFFNKSMSPPEPPAGSYTPGVPPWMEKGKNVQARSTNNPTPPPGVPQSK